jgi:hypothetical protein
MEDIKEDMKEDMKWRAYWLGGRGGRPRARHAREENINQCAHDITRACVERFSRPPRPPSLMNKGLVLLLDVLLDVLHVLFSSVLGKKA